MPGCHVEGIYDWVNQACNWRAGLGDEAEAFIYLKAYARVWVGSPRRGDFEHVPWVGSPRRGDRGPLGERTLPKCDHENAPWATAVRSASGPYLSGPCQNALLPPGRFPFLPHSH
jgi:hypothetical protein